MKKFKLLLSLSILFFAIYSCDQQSEFDSLESNELKRPITKPFETISTENDINYCGEPIECTLIAGQSIDAGTVTVSNNGTHLYVKVYSTAGFQDVDENIKMWIGTELPKKRPPAGHFPYKVTESGDTHIFEIKLTDLYDDDVWDGECGEETKPLYIIVHADVLTEAGSAETAFGGCIEGEGKAWWYYMEYTTQCCEDCVEEVALGKKLTHSYCLTYIDNEENEHFVAWSNNFNFKGLLAPYPFSLYANATTCDPDFDRFAIGDITIMTYSEGIGDGSNLYADITIAIKDPYPSNMKEYKLSAVDLFITTDPNPLDEDGKFDNTKGDYYYKKLNEQTGYTEFTFTKVIWPGAPDTDEFDVFVIPRAKICEVE